MHVVKRVGRNAKKGCPTMGAPKGVPCMRLVRRPPQGRTHDRPGSNGGAGRVEGVLTRETDIAESNPGLRRPHGFLEDASLRPKPFGYEAFA